MGFLTDVIPSTGNPAAGQGLCALTRNGSLVAGTQMDADIPGGVQDGDLLFAFFTSAANPTVAWSTPTGWTAALAQKNGASSFGGRAALFRKVWRTGDSLTVSSTGPGTDVAVCVIVARSGTDGASLTISTPAENEGTVATTTLVMPRAAVSAKYDLRLFFFRTTATANAVATPPTPAANADNPFRAPPVQVYGAAGVGIQATGAAIGLWSDPSGTDAGTTNWTISSGKYYAVAVTVNDPNAVSNGIAMGHEEDPFSLLVVPLATGVEHATIVNTGGAGGGGIAVG